MAKVFAVAVLPCALGNVAAVEVNPFRSKATLKDKDAECDGLSLAQLVLDQHDRQAESSSAGAASSLGDKLSHAQLVLHQLDRQAESRSAGATSLRSLLAEEGKEESFASAGLEEKEEGDVSDQTKLGVSR